MASVIGELPQKEFEFVHKMASELVARVNRGQPLMPEVFSQGASKGAAIGALAYFGAIMLRRATMDPAEFDRIVGNKAKEAPADA